MQQNNDEYFSKSLLSTWDYENIEKKVLYLYKELNITSFPINPFDIAKKLGYNLVPFSSLNIYEVGIVRYYVKAGLDLKFINGNNYIFYEDLDSDVRIKFTIMHEIGHIILGHREESDFANQCANYFASYSLVPTPMIHAFKCSNDIDIMNKFDVSSDCAYFSFKRFENWKYIVDFKDYEIKLLKQFNYEIK